MEKLVNDYVLSYTNNSGLQDFQKRLYINTDLGNESLRIFRNGFDIESFTYEELVNLAWLVTREIRAQINDDHFRFWSWSAFVVDHCLSVPTIPMPAWFRHHSGYDWFPSFSSLISLLLARYSVFDYEHSSALGNVITYSETIAGPLSYAVLEGLLRRKNGAFINEDGEVHTRFPKYDHTGKARAHFEVGENLNRIKYSVRLFEKDTCSNRGRPCLGLPEIHKEIFNLYSSGDSYDLLDYWRNDLVHGNIYWNNRVAIIVNMICLLILDEIGPSVYASHLSEFKRFINFRRNNNTPNRSQYDIYLSV